MFRTLLVLVVWTVPAMGAKPETERMTVARSVARRKKDFIVISFRDCVKGKSVLCCQTNEVVLHVS